jgi:hypothetical protein
MFIIKQANSTRGMTVYTERLFGDGGGEGGSLSTVHIHELVATFPIQSAAEIVRFHHNCRIEITGQSAFIFFACLSGSTVSS